MLPVFDNYTWIFILIVCMFSLLKDWRQFKEFTVYMKILHLTSFIIGICVIDVLAGKPYLNRIIPNYIVTLLPATLLVWLACLSKTRFDEIKNSDLSEDDKNKEYRKQKRAILGFIFAGIWMYLMTIGISLFSIIGNIFGKIFNFIL